jgi:hypothetical protein
MRSVILPLITSSPNSLKEAGESSPAAIGFATGDLLGIAVILAIGGAMLLWAYLWVRHRLAQERELEEQAQAEFMRRATEECAVASAKPSVPEGKDAASNAAVAEAAWVVPSRERLIARLREANLLLSEEGVCTIPGCPAESKIIRLRDQRLALIVPFLDAHEFVKHNQKRFDVFFLLLSENETAVLQRYQDYVAENLSFK